MIGLPDDRAAWLGQAVLPWEGMLRAWLSRRPLGGLEPDDVIQESYTRLIRLERVDHIRDAKTYLFQVAKSVVRDHLRRASVVSILTLPSLDAATIPDDAPTAEDVVSGRQDLAALAAAIAALPEPTRTVFRLRRVDQLPQREIAARLGMPESTVEKHVMRALLAIAQQFGRGGREAPGASIGKKRAERSKHGKGDRS